MSKGVIIARFQTPYLYTEQEELISKVAAAHDEVVVLLGVSPLKLSSKNPFDFQTRKSLIRAEFKQIRVLALKDHPSDEEWSANLDKMLKEHFPESEFTLYGSKDRFIPYYTGENPIKELPKHWVEDTEAFNAYFESKATESADFRAGIMYTVLNQYKKVFATVDMAVFRMEKSQILLGRKAISDQWRFPGGFSDPEDNSYQEAALREMKEECGELEVENVQFEVSAKVPDWRYKNEEDKIITSLFSCDLIGGEAKAQDDISELKWFAVSELAGLRKKDAITSEHHSLIDFLLDKYSFW